MNLWHRQLIDHDFRVSPFSTRHFPFCFCSVSVLVATINRPLSVETSSIYLLLFIYFYKAFENPVHFFKKSNGEIIYNNAVLMSSQKLSLKYLIIMSEYSHRWFFFYINTARTVAFPNSLSIDSPFTNYFISIGCTVHCSNFQHMTFKGQPTVVILPQNCWDARVVTQILEPVFPLCSQPLSWWKKNPPGSNRWPLVWLQVGKENLRVWLRCFPVTQYRLPSMTKQAWQQCPQGAELLQSLMKYSDWKEMSISTQVFSRLRLYSSSSVIWYGLSYGLALFK